LLTLFLSNTTRILLGEYKKGDIVEISLTDKQLHENLYTADPYTADPFISISFRFNTNPFTNSNENQTVQNLIENENPE